ncbi:MAG TPA: thymidylate synthase [candidate division Zixibacteria bacterium]|nr:thymidylate synthase [candidate division Zixibacteria bacterium]
MVYTFHGPGANEAWMKAALVFNENKSVSRQKSRGGVTNELLHAAFTIESPLNRWVVSRFPAMNPAFSIIETIWVINGRNDAGFLNKWNKQLPKYAGRCQTYHGAYGHRLRHLIGLDQLSRAYEVLRLNPDSRQVVLQIWNPGQDLPNSDGSPIAEDIPCNIASMLKVRDKKLEWTQVVRSNDMFLGVPHDFVLFTTLQEVIAGWLDIEIGSYNHFSDSLHVYLPDLKHILKARDMVSAENTDSLALPKIQSEKIWFELANRAVALVSDNLTKSDIQKQLRLNAPIGYLNLLRLICAEAARKRKWNEFVTEIISDLSNPVLRQLWFQWLERISGRKKMSDVRLCDSKTTFNTPISKSH